MKSPKTSLTPPPAAKEAILSLYNDYAHQRLSRADFVKKLSAYAVGGWTVASLMSFVMPDYAGKVQIPVDDPRVESAYIQYSSPHGAGTMKALLCQPKEGAGRRGGIIVVHENRGLNPHIEDVARRAALAGFVALAPDALTPLGGYPGNDDEGRTLQSQRNREEMLEDFKAAFQFLKAHPTCNGKVGVVGFCFGGWVSNMMAVQLPDLAAAVPFYGGQAPLDQVSQIQAPLQLHYAALDARVNEGWPPYRDALEKHGKSFVVYEYPETHHGFHNDTTPRFDAEAAKLAWERTIAFFKTHLQ